MVNHLYTKYAEYPNIKQQETNVIALYFEMLHHCSEWHNLYRTY